ncbi:MAG TPA: hypothetical protein ENN09_01990 [Planctomycetes bacterium]|nr:hypothetical protein [Planctomycetota bacterium]
MPADDKDTAEALARWIKRARLQTPFIFLLEAHRPIIRLLGHGLNIFEPVAAGFLGVERIERLRCLFFDPDAVERVAALLQNWEDADGAASD